MPADAPHVRLADVDDLPLDQLAAAVDGARPLAGGDRQGETLRHFGQRVQVLRWHRVLVEEQVVVLQLLADPDGVRHGEPRRAVDVDAQIDVVRERVPQPAHGAHRLLRAAALQRGVALLDQLQGRVRLRGVGVDAHPLAAHPPQQIDDRHAELLAQNVPEGDLDPGHRPGADDAGHAVAHHPQQHLLPQQLDAPRVLPDEHGLEVLDRRLDHPRPAAGLTDSGDPFVGLDFDEEPVAPASAPAPGRRRVHQKGLDVRDLHRGPSLLPAPAGAPLERPKAGPGGRRRAVTVAARCRAWRPGRAAPSGRARWGRRPSTPRAPSSACPAARRPG